jgi:hypothetical protein
MNASEKNLTAAAAWWQVENEGNPSEQNARMLAIFEWLVDASPQERAEWFEKTGGFEAEMTKAVLNGIADDAPEAAVEVLTEMSR